MKSNDRTGESIEEALNNLIHMVRSVYWDPR